MVSILIVNDDFDFAEAMKLHLIKNGFDTHSVESGERCFEELRTHTFDIVIVEQDISGMNGLEILREIKTHHRVIEVIFISRKGDVETAIKAMKLGAREYFKRPFDLDSLLLEVRKIEKELKMPSTLTEPGTQNLRELFRFENLTSKNYHTQKIIDEARSFAQTDINILLTGESGTGKGLLARTIHYNSPRWKEPFIEINSSAIPSTLLESELFGHERGAFTDARETRQGLLEIAHNSTLFLDEISTMDFNMQSKLLKVLEDFKFYRVGGRKEINVNVRLITATNADLKKLVDDGKFRDDLFYRLNVAAIRLPPLRERKEDLVDIFMKFVREFNELFEKNIDEIEPEAKKLLEAYKWPGNIRELRNVCERIMITMHGRIINKYVLPMEIQSGYDEIKDMRDSFKSLKEVEMEHINRTLRALKGNKSRAAAALGISRTALIYKVKEYEEKEDN